MSLKRTKYVEDQYPLAGNMDWLRTFADSLHKQAQSGEDLSLDPSTNLLEQIYQLVNDGYYVSDKNTGIVWKINYIDRQNLTINATGGNINERGVFVQTTQKQFPINENIINYLKSDSVEISEIPMGGISKDQKTSSIETAISEIDQAYDNMIASGQITSDLATIVNNFHYSIVDQVKKQVNNLGKPGSNPEFFAKSLNLNKIALNWNNIELPQSFITYRNTVFQILSKLGKDIRHNLGGNFANSILDTAFKEMNLPKEKNEPSISDTPQEPEQELEQELESGPEPEPELEPEPEPVETTNFQKLKFLFSEFYNIVTQLESSKYYQSIKIYEKEPEVKKILNQYGDLKKQLDYLNVTLQKYALNLGLRKEAQVLENFRNNVSRVPGMGWLATPDEKRRREQNIQSDPNFIQQKNKAIADFVNILSTDIQPKVKELLQQVSQTFNDPSITAEQRKGIQGQIWPALSAAQQILSQMNLPVQNTQIPTGTNGTSSTTIEPTPTEIPSTEQEQVVEQEIMENDPNTDQQLRTERNKKNQRGNTEQGASTKELGEGAVTETGGPAVGKRLPPDPRKESYATTIHNMTGILSEAIDYMSIYARLSDKIDKQKLKSIIRRLETIKTEIIDLEDVLSGESASTEAVPEPSTVDVSPPVDSTPAATPPVPSTPAPAPTNPAGLGSAPKRRREVRDEELKLSPISKNNNAWLRVK